MLSQACQEPKHGSVILWLSSTKHWSARGSHALVDNTSHRYNLAECNKTVKQIHYLFLTLQEFEDASRLIVRTENPPEDEQSLNSWPCPSQITAPAREWWLSSWPWSLLRLWELWFWAAGATCACRSSASLRMRRALWVREKPKSPFCWCSILLKDPVWRGKLS